MHNDDAETTAPADYTNQTEEKAAKNANLTSSPLPEADIETTCKFHAPIDPPHALFVGVSSISNENDLFHIAFTVLQF